MLALPIDNYYDEGKISLSVPCILGRQGVIQPLQPALDASEQAALHTGAAALRQVYQDTVTS